MALQKNLSYNSRLIRRYFLKYCDSGNNITRRSIAGGRHITLSRTRLYSQPTSPFGCTNTKVRVRGCLSILIGNSMCWISSLSNMQKKQHHLEVLCKFFNKTSKISVIAWEPVQKKTTAKLRPICTLFSHTAAKHKESNYNSLKEN